MALVRQLGFMVILAASIALGVAAVLWSTGSSNTPLYLDLSTQDTADVVAALEQNGTDFEIDSRSGMILVPTNSIREIRLQLASNGLPRSTNRGYDILEDEQALGTSNFLEQARYNRALEQELIQTIGQIQSVRSARVHLSIPKQSSFIRSSSRKPSASVMIDLYHQQSLSAKQLMGVSHLVASSVAGLNSDDVSIVDQSGNLLSRSSDTEYNSSNENIRFTREIEEDYSNRIIDILTPIVGAGNVRAKVSADLDFTYEETTAETYDPRTAVVRSEQSQEEKILGSTTVETPQPGALSADAPLTDPGASQSTNNGQTRINSTRNYEIDRSVSVRRTIPGTINHLSVAVLIDLDNENSPAIDNAEDSTANVISEPIPADPEKIARLTQLVKDTIGFSEIRGDSINIINEKFMALEEFPAPEAIPIWQQAWVFTALKSAVGVMVVLFLIFGVLRPAMKSVVSGVKSLPSPSNNYSNSATMSEDTVSLTGNSEHANLPAPAPIGKSVYDENLVLAQTLVQNEPARAARMVQKWLTNE